MKNPERGEIWMVNLNPTKGREQSGIRPALVISVDIFNSSAADLVIVIPITSKNRNIPLHVEIPVENSSLKLKSYIKTENIRSISKERLINQIGEVEEEIINEVEKRLKLLLKL